MKKAARRILRKILKILTKAVLRKHSPTIIALIGESSTAVPREILYQILHTHFPTRRNIESPEAEFVVPLTVIGADHYPQDAVEWLELMLKTIGQLIFFPVHSNILILEMNTGLSEILNYWLEITKPDFLITCGTHPPSDYIEQENTLKTPTAQPTQPEQYKGLALKIGLSLGLSEKEIKNAFTNLSFPEPRIRLLPGRDGHFVIDATYKYFPPLKQSIDEVLKPLSGNKTWVRSKKDWKNIKSEKGDILIVYGPRKELLPLLEKVTPNPLAVPKCKS